MFTKPFRGITEFTFENKRFALTNDKEIPLDILQGLVDFYKTNRAQIIELPSDSREKLTLLFREKEAVLIIEDGKRLDRAYLDIKAFTKEICLDFEKYLDIWTDFCSYKNDSRNVWDEKNEKIRSLIDVAEAYSGNKKHFVIKNEDGFDCAFDCPDTEVDCAFCPFFDLILKKLYEYEEKDNKGGF